MKVGTTKIRFLGFIVLVAFATLKAEAEPAQHAALPSGESAKSGESPRQTARHELMRLGENGTSNLEVQLSTPDGGVARFLSVFAETTDGSCKALSVGHAFDFLFDAADPNKGELKTADFGSFKFSVKRFPGYEELARKNHAAEKSRKLGGTIGAALGALSGGGALGAMAGKKVGEIAADGIGQLSQQTPAESQAAAQPEKEAPLMAPPGDLAVISIDDSKVCDQMREKQQRMQKKFEFGVCQQRPKPGVPVYIGAANLMRMVRGEATGSINAALKAFDVKLDTKSIKQGDSGGGYEKSENGEQCVAGIQSMGDTKNGSAEGYTDDVILTDLTDPDIKKFLSENKIGKSGDSPAVAGQPKGPHENPLAGGGAGSTGSQGISHVQKNGQDKVVNSGSTKVPSAVRVLPVKRFKWNGPLARAVRRVGGVQ